MKGEFDSFNLNIEVGWIAPHGINNGEDHGEVVDLVLNIIYQGLTAQPKRVLNEKPSDKWLQLGRIPLAEWVVEQGNARTTQQRTPPQG